MKLALYDDNRVALVEGDTLYDVSAAVPGWGQPWPPVFMQRLIAEWPAARPALLAARAAAQPIARGAVKLQTGRVANYAFAMLIGLVVFVSLFLYTLLVGG